MHCSGSDALRRFAAIRDSRITILLHLVIGAAILNASIAFGGESPQSNKESGPVVEIPTSRWSGDTGVNFVTAYFAYGILQENKGAIAEPYLDISRTLFESDGFITKATIGLQLWSSIHSEKTGAKRNNSLPQWYEFDYYVPIGVTIAKRWTLTVSYLEYEFPNGAFTAQRGVQANLAYDDTDVLGAFALHPHAMILYNFEGILGIGLSDAWYAEFGVAPSFSLASKSKYPVTVTFPLTVALGDNHFYPGDRYGYFSATANASVPLAFIPKSFGPWTVNAGLTYYNLGGATAAINAHGDHTAYVGQLGIGLTF
jgi:hypothetical protein